MYSSHQPFCNSLQVLEAFEEVGSWSFEAHFLYIKSIDAKMKRRDQTQQDTKSGKQWKSSKKGGR